jgi:hypothetical protein
MFEQKKDQGAEPKATSSPRSRLAHVVFEPNLNASTSFPYEDIVVPLRTRGEGEEPGRVLTYDEVLALDIEIFDFTVATANALDELNPEQRTVAGVLSLTQQQFRGFPGVTNTEVEEVRGFLHKIGALKDPS